VVAMFRYKTRTNVLHCLAVLQWDTACCSALQCVAAANVQMQETLVRPTHVSTPQKTKDPVRA